MVDGWMKIWLDGWSMRVMLMHHSLLGCLWQLKNYTGLTCDLPYSFIEYSCHICTWLQTSVICLRAEQPSRETHNSRWFRLRANSWNSTRANTKCCCVKCRPFGLRGVWEQQCGKAPGVVTGSELNMNMNSSLRYTECSATPQHLRTDRFLLPLITHFPHLRLRKLIYYSRNPMDIDIKQWLQHCTPNLIKVQHYYFIWAHFEHTNICT